MKGNVTSSELLSFPPLMDARCVKTLPWHHPLQMLKTNAKDALSKQYLVNALSCVTNLQVSAVNFHALNETFNKYLNYSSDVVNTLEIMMHFDC